MVELDSNDLKLRDTSNKRKSIVDSLDLESISSQKSGNEDENWKTVLTLCQQTNPIPFGLEFSSRHFTRLEPIDSGSYSLVSRGFDKRINKEVVFKIINVVSSKITKTLFGVSFDGMEQLADVVNEIMISKSLSDLHSTIVDYRGHEFIAHSFPRMLSSRLVQGSIPNYLTFQATNDSMKRLDKIELNRESPGTPNEYLVITLKNCGQPIWKVIRTNTLSNSQVLSICYQLTLALTVAECVLEFEHRDLHVANVLVKKTKKKYIIYVIKTQTYRVQTFGIKATIIDTTFSRIKFGTNVFFTSLSNRLNCKLKVKNPDLQDWVYIQMAEEAKDDWQKWNPQTNLFWLRYFYKTMQTCSVVKKSKDKNSKLILKELLKNVVKYKCLEDFVENMDNIR